MKKMTAVTIFFALALAVRADFRLDFRAAEKLASDKKFTEAKEAYLKLAGGDLTREQKMQCFSKAIAIALREKNVDEALKIASRMPEKPYATLLELRVLASSGRGAEILSRFGESDFQDFPDDCAGEAYFIRGEIFSGQKKGAEAESDLSKAMECVSPKTDWMRYAAVALRRGENLERNLKDASRALEIYTAGVKGVSGKFSWATGECLVNAVRLLVAEKKFTEADELLKNFNIDTMTGHWGAVLLNARASLYKAEGKNAEAKQDEEKARTLRQAKK